MLSRLRPLAWPLLLAVAAAIYSVRFHEDMVDFEVYRVAAGRAMDGENLYRPQDGHYQFKYLPAFAFAMAPFAMVEDRIARLVWYALSFGLLCIFVRWCARGVPEKRLRDVALIGLAILFVGRFYGRDLLLGQTNILLGTTLMAALLAAEAGARRTAGVLVALGVCIKPYALILVPWLWVVAGASGLAASGVALATALLLPAAAYGWHGNIDLLSGWYRTVTDTNAPNLLTRENISFAATWAKWIGPGPAASRLALATSAVAAGLAVGIIARRRDVREPAYLEFGALMLLVPLISPQGWDYVLLLATPAFLVLADRWREMSRGWRALTVIGIGGVSLTNITMMGPTLYSHAMRINVIGIGALVLVVCLRHLRMRRLA